MENEMMSLLQNSVLVDGFGQMFKNT